MAEQQHKDESEKPKIVVDDAWKAQAQAEKQHLAEQTAEQAERAAGQAQARELPPPSFATLVSSLVAQVLLSLGGVEDPKTKKRYVDLDLAKHHIDMLSVLEDKTRGNLTDDEKKLLDHSLYETRMHYVQIAQHVPRAGR